MAEFFGSVWAELPATVLGVVATLVIVWINAVPKLRIFYTPYAEFDIPKGTVGALPGSVFRVETMLIRNNNLTKAVEEVEICFAQRPPGISVSPHSDYEEQTLPNGKWLLKLQKVQPREQIKIDFSYFSQSIPAVISIRSSEGPKTPEAAMYQPAVSAWRVVTVLVFAAIGVAAVFASVWWGASFLGSHTTAS